MTRCSPPSKWPWALMGPKSMRRSWNWPSLLDWRTNTAVIVLFPSLPKNILYIKNMFFFSIINLLFVMRLFFFLVPQIVFFQRTVGHFFSFWVQGFAPRSLSLLASWRELVVTRFTGLVVSETKLSREIPWIQAWQDLPVDILSQGCSELEFTSTQLLTPETGKCGDGVDLRCVKEPFEMMLRSSEAIPKALVDQPWQVRKTTIIIHHIFGWSWTVFLFSTLHVAVDSFNFG